MPGFEWHTDDEGDWEEPVHVPGTAVSHTRLYALLLIGCFLGLGGFALYSFLSQRVNTATQALESQVLASHHLLQTAVRTDDRELFASLLSRRDPNWWEIQQLLFDQHLFLDRAPLGLWAAVPVSQPVTVTLSPDLTVAEVVEVLPYQRQSGETVYLRQTAVYERHGDNWLLAPPPDLETFWGEWREWQNGRFTLLYPARDEAIGQRLAADLSVLVEALCADSAVRCPEWGLDVRLGGDIYRLQQLNYVPDLFPTTSYDYIALPAPTLVGRPVDEAGYQALYRGYAGWIGATILVRFAAPEQFTRDWVVGELAEYGLQPPVLPGISIQAQRPPPIPFPEQDIEMLCVNNSVGRLLRYSPQTQTWHDEPVGNLDMPPFFRPPLLPFPDDSGVLLTVADRSTGNLYDMPMAWRMDEKGQWTFAYFPPGDVFDHLTSTPDLLNHIQTILPVHKLLDNLPEAERPNQLQIVDVIPNPALSEQLFIGAISESNYYLFLFSQRTGFISLFRNLSLWSFEQPEVTITQNGRFLTLAIPAQKNTPTEPGWNINIHDLSHTWLHAYPAPLYTPHNPAAYDWSAGEQWLVIPDEGFLRLIAPAYNYEWPIFHHITNCTSVAWVNRSGD